MTIAKHLDKKATAPFCSICGREERACSPDADACVCSTCTGQRSWGDHESEKDCPGCGKRKIAGDLDLCPVCIRQVEKAARAEKLRARNERAANRAAKQSSGNFDMGLDSHAADV